MIVPITVGAIYTPDAYSAAAVKNKGLYNPVDAEASPLREQFSIRKEKPALPPALAAAEAARQGADTPAGAIAQAPPLEEGQPGADPQAQAQTNVYGAFTLEDLKQQVEQSPEGNFMLSVPEIAFTVGDTEVENVLGGQPVETVAQIMPEKLNNPNGTRARIFRLFVQCCMADARPLSVPVEFGKEPPAFREMGWVKIVGSIEYVVEGGKRVPLLNAKAMEETEAPKNPYG